MKSEPLTLCFHTRDAVERDDSSLTFEVPRNSTNATKVALASCEFPMAQWTIEEDWNRMYLNEGIRLDADTSFLDITCRAPKKEQVSLHIQLPLHLNKVLSTSRSGNKLTVECEALHGLWLKDDVPFSPAFASGVSLIGGRNGDAVLSMEDVKQVSPTSFTVSDSKADGAQFLCISTIPSPKVLCEWLSFAMRGVTDAVRLSCRYASDTNQVLIHAAVKAPDTMVQVTSTPLAKMLGVATILLRVSTSETLPCGTAAFWNYVEMPGGHYAPCHRPMSTGQPLRFGPELEMAINRLYFPLGKPEQGSPSPLSPHILLFSDSAGKVYTCTVPCGRYSPHQLCTYLETEMSRVADAENLIFSVSHENDRFVFSCERRDSSGVITPAVFGLLFHHPLSLHSERLGFAAQPLFGSHTYVAPRRTRPLYVDAHGRTLSNLLRVTEMSSQKRFSFHGTSLPPVTGVVVSSDLTKQRAILMRTYVNRLPFAHGFQAGDVVRIGAIPGTSVMSGTGDEMVEVKETAVRFPIGTCSCVVANHPESSNDPCFLALEGVPPLDGLGDTGTCLQVISDPEPWNMCFNCERTLPPHLIGFTARAIQWGVDGSVGNAEGQRLPPFEAPHMHCLDHPDYVLITFSESAGASFEHSFAGETKSLFCKLSLYPLFREERMLPRDTALLQSGMSRFTIRFWNPDFRTPYRFHGAQFSFSLSFI